MSENKTGKYLKYAIGEIVLVVIGILVALSINNWNEERKRSKQELYLLQQMQKEIMADSITLERFTFLVNKKVTDGKLLRQTIEGQIQLSIDSIVSFSFFNGKAVLFNAYTPTFDEIVSSGKLEVLSGDELKNKIKTYKNIINQYHSFLYYEVQRRKETYNTHLFNYFEAEIMAHLWKNVSFGAIKIDGLENYSMRIDDFFKDPETFNQLNTLIGVDQELAWTYETIYKRLLSDVMKELQIQINQFDD